MVNTAATIGLSALVLLGAGGGLTYAAEQSVPGDVLYGFKTNVNESLMTIGMSAEAKAKNEVTLAERRMDEWNTLKADGKLDVETNAKMKAEIDQHFANAQEYIGNVEADADANADMNVTADINNRLDAAVQTYSALGSTINVNAEDEDTSSSEGSMSEDSETSADDSLDTSVDVDTSLDGNVDIGY